VPQSAWIAAIVVIVLVLGLIGWKVFGSNSDVESKEQIQAHLLRKKKKEGD
jgi:hypothetical protein